MVGLEEEQEEDEDEEPPVVEAYEVEMLAAPERKSPNSPRKLISRSCLTATRRFQSTTQLRVGFQRLIIRLPVHKVWRAGARV